MSKLPFRWITVTQRETSLVKICKKLTKYFLLISATQKQIFLWLRSTSNTWEWLRRSLTDNWAASFWMGSCWNFMPTILTQPTPTCSLTWWRAKRQCLNFCKASKRRERFCLEIWTTNSTLNVFCKTKTYLTRWRGNITRRFVSQWSTNSRTCCKIFMKNSNKKELTSMWSNWSEAARESLPLSGPFQKCLPQSRAGQ